MNEHRFVVNLARLVSTNGRTCISVLHLVLRFLGLRQRHQAAVDHRHVGVLLQNPLVAFLRVNSLVDAVRVIRCGVDHIQRRLKSADHSSERSKAGFIQARVIDVVDEQLSGAGVRASRGISDGPVGVGYQHGVVRDNGIPFLGLRRESGDAELQHEIRNHAEKRSTVVKSVIHQRKQSVCSKRSPSSDDLDDDRRRGLTINDNVGVERDGESVRGDRIRLRAGVGNCVINSARSRSGTLKANSHNG
mmetsp:Transcript_51693/g.90174  ORF Transcript_51693/g.90174 Transcript_51693/m.90174 type:complete len:247 (-) Transcript_51693:32-772(-)